MSNTETGPRYPPYTEYVMKLSYQNPELAPLAQLLTGRYPPSTRSIAWTTSSTVDVCVVDVYHDPAHCPTVREIRDMESLKETATHDISDTIAMRLFLVEDVTAPVIEILGSVYGCHPYFFRAHMQSDALQKKTSVDAHGYLTLQSKSAQDYSQLSGTRFTLTETARLPFFSLPFYRGFQYRNQERREQHETKRTMPRKYYPKSIIDGTLEERISGTFITETASENKCRVGILLFDSIGESLDLSTRSSIYRPLFDRIPPFSASSMLPIPPRPVPSRGVRFNQSTRAAILSQFTQRRFVEQILQDNGLLFCAVMNCLAGAWLDVISRTEHDIQPSSEDITEFVQDNLFLEALMDLFPEVHENIAMLTESLALLRSRGCHPVRCKNGTVASELIKNLTIDFQDLLRRAEQHKIEIQQRVVTIAAVRSITESSKAIEQSDAIGALTAVATFFIPLSFVSSLFGMNVKEISAESTPIWMFFAIAVALTSISLLVLGYWKTLRSSWNYLTKRSKDEYGDVEYRREKWKNLLGVRRVKKLAKDTFSVPRFRYTRGS
ncbi:hypothetical protein V8F20_004066 [Naviculisporaceae sp. PSN 640]